MTHFIKYLKYIIKHKWYVGIECFKVGLYWQGIAHDLSKFLPSEFIPYADFFYGKNSSINESRHETGYYKSTNSGDNAFDFAWLLHQKRNRHHWQWFVLPEDDGGTKLMNMTPKYRMEMICDWIGAGKAQGFHSPKTDKFGETRKWYNKNKDKMQMSVETRKFIEDYISA